jgi:DNA-binding NtrC family response regulator
MEPINYIFPGGGISCQMENKTMTKNILFYSPDFNLCYSLLVYLQDKYNVTVSTDFHVLKSLTKSNNFDLLIIDSEPDTKIEQLCAEINNSSSPLKVILTYVYDKKMNAAEKRIRKYISTILYKPFDLTEISKSFPDILKQSETNLQ